jgi:DNA-binding GntR family transcriptional regulator
MTTKRPHLLSPISHVTLTDNVYKALKKHILTLELPLGARVRDEDIAEQLGVSRTPVREAIRNLIRDGLMEVIPRSKTRVCMLSEADVNEIFDLRVALESLAARLSADRIPEKQRQHLNQLHTLAEAGLKQDDSRPALEFDREMHRLILENCGNVRLISMMNTINDFVTLFRNLNARTPAHRGFNYRHREIMRALMREDGPAAAKAIEEHILMAKEQTQRDFQHQEMDQAREKSQKVNRRFRGSTA